eukprot:451345-Rhodomonas_salina.1
MGGGLSDCFRGRLQVVTHSLSRTDLRGRTQPLPELYGLHFRYGPTHVLLYCPMPALRRVQY